MVQRKNSPRRRLSRTERVTGRTFQAMKRGLKAKTLSRAEMAKSPPMPKALQRTFARGMRAEYEQLVRTGQKGSAAKTLRSMAEHPEGPMRREAARLAARATPRVGLGAAARSVLGRVGGVAAWLAIPDELEAAKGEDEWARRKRLRYAQEQVAAKRAKRGGRRGA